MLDRDGACDRIAVLTEELRLSQEAYLNAPISAMLRDRLIEVGARLGNEFNVLMATAGKVEGAVGRICDTIEPKSLSQFFLNPSMNAAIEARTSILQDAFESSGAGDGDHGGERGECDGGDGCDGGEGDGGGGGDGGDGGA